VLHADGRRLQELATTGDCRQPLDGPSPAGLSRVKHGGPAARRFAETGRARCQGSAQSDGLTDSYAEDRHHAIFSATFAPGIGHGRTGAAAVAPWSKQRDN
jgi:hypothetical protein